MTRHDPQTGKPLPAPRPFGRPMTEAEAETVMRSLHMDWWDQATVAEASCIHHDRQRRESENQDFATSHRLGLAIYAASAATAVLFGVFAATMMGWLP